MSDRFEIVDETSARLTGVGPGGPTPGLVQAVDMGVVWLARVIVCATLTALFAILFLNVVLRYLFDSGLVWSQEVSTLLFPWLVIAGAVLAAQTDKHVSVCVLVEALPGSVGRWVLIGINVLIVLMAIVVVDAALTILEASHRNRLAVTHIPQSYGYASLIYGYAMLGLTALTTGYRQVFAADGPE